MVEILSRSLHHLEASVHRFLETRANQRTVKSRPRLVTPHDGSQSTFIVRSEILQRRIFP